MDFFNATKKNFSTPAEVQKISESPVEEKISDSKSCDRCGAREWWEDNFRSGRKCLSCNPPASESFVGWEFFFDDDGRKWFVVVEGDKEHWVKERDD